MDRHAVLPSLACRPGRPPMTAPSRALAAERLRGSSVSAARCTSTGLYPTGVIPRVAPKHSRFALDRDAVEALSLARLRPGRPHQYWLTPGEAAEVLSLSRKWVLQPAERGRLPAVQHDGRWYFRRHQIQVLTTPGSRAGSADLRAGGSSPRMCLALHCWSCSLNIPVCASFMRRQNFWLASLPGATSALTSTSRSPPGG